jgi:hypothetical protein
MFELFMRIQHSESYFNKSSPLQERGSLRDIEFNTIQIEKSFNRAFQIRKKNRKRKKKERETWQQHDWQQLRARFPCRVTTP